MAETFDELCQQARGALGQGNAEAAKRLYLKAVGENPQSPEAHYGLATACFVLGEYESAALYFKEVIRLDPLRAGAYVNLGAVYSRLGQLDEAVKALRRAIQLDSRRAEAYYNLGLVYRRQGLVEQAIQAYREALRINPRMPDAYYNLGNLLLEMGRYSQAVAAYKEGLQINPNMEKARQGLAQAEAALRGPEGERAVEAAEPQGPDLSRTLDPQADGAMLAALHRATKESEEHCRRLSQHLEHETDASIKELSSALLYPVKTGTELSDRIKRFEAALESMRDMTRTFQEHIKRLRELTEQLIGGGAPSS